MLRTLTLILLCLLMASCATLLNERWMFIKIKTSNPGATLVIRGDTLGPNVNIEFVPVERTNQPLVITAFNPRAAGGQKLYAPDTVAAKTVSVPQRNSFAWYLNAYPSIHLWTGFLIDRNNPKRYGYPNTIYLDTENPDSSYLTHIPIGHIRRDYRHLVKTSLFAPLLIYRPALELSYEYCMSRRTSTQLTAGALLPAGVWDVFESYKPHFKGYNIALEQRLYLRRTAPHGWYIAAGLEYARARHYEVGDFVPPAALTGSMVGYIIYADSITVQRQSRRLHLKLGYQWARRHFSVDFYVGLGLRHDEVVHTGRRIPGDVPTREKYPPMWVSPFHDGKFYNIDVPAGIRIGFAF